MLFRSPSAPSVFASYTSVSGPSLDHLRQVARARLRRPTRWPSVVGQLARSWYVFAFHVPVLGRRAPTLLAALVSGDGPAPTTSDQLRGIRLYRANIIRRLMSGRAPRCDVRTIVVVPNRDRMVSTNLTEGLGGWIPHLRILEVDAGHWWPFSHPVEAADVLRSQF